MVEKNLGGTLLVINGEGTSEGEGTILNLMSNTFKKIGVEGEKEQWDSTGFTHTKSSVQSLSSPIKLISVAGLGETMESFCQPEQTV